MLAHPLNRMLQRIDTRARGNRTELADAGIDCLRMALNIGVVAKLGIRKRNPLPDFRKPPKLGIAQYGGWMNNRLAVARGQRGMSFGRFAHGAKPKTKAAR